MAKHKHREQDPLINETTNNNSNNNHNLGFCGGLNPCNNNFGCGTSC